MVLDQSKPVTPTWLIWIQCIAFVVLYAVWILPEIVGVRNTALVIGALAGLYPIYQYRAALWTKRAIPIWLIIALFAWATFHLFFLSQDFAAQLLEFKRIWKYAAIGAIFAFGLGLSLANEASSKFQRMVYFGLATPVLIYLLKFALTTYGPLWKIQPPPYLQIYFFSQPYYVPKTDYVAFCLPPLAIALGQIQYLVVKQQESTWAYFEEFIFALSIIGATLFLFDVQNIKNGMAYAAICLAIFSLLTLFKKSQSQWWKKSFWMAAVLSIFAAGLYTHTYKNDSWKTLIADAKVAFQTEKYEQWKYAGTQGYPINEYGKQVSVTNYERASWFKVGNELSWQNPLGYGLIEDSFKRMVKAKWSEASSNLSHSHSGWLDVILAVGYPGFFLILGAILVLLVYSLKIVHPWGAIVFWGLLAQALLWISTEVSATITFAALIFWLSWGSGLCLSSFMRGTQKIRNTT